MDMPGIATASTYPDAPWRLSGRVWTGLFRADQSAPIPAGLRPLLPGSWVTVTLARYLEGTRRYDELIVGPLVRRGPRFGVHVDHIWVSDDVSRLGGRRIWGLPKRLAEFAWGDSSVTIIDERGCVADIAFDDRMSRVLPIPAAGMGFGCLDGVQTHVVARGWARPARSGMQVSASSSHFRYRISPRPFLSLAANPFRITVQQPAVLSGSHCLSTQADTEDP